MSDDIELLVTLSIGYPTATIEETVWVDSKEIEGLNDVQKDSYFFEAAKDALEPHVEFYYEVVGEGEE